MIAYLNGAQTGATQTTLGTFVGALGATTTNIAASSTVPANPWAGFVAHVALGNRALTAAEVARLGTI
jgi:hypothetical protein